MSNVFCVSLNLKLYEKKKKETFRLWCMCESSSFKTNSFNYAIFLGTIFLFIRAMAAQCLND